MRNKLLFKSNVTEKDMKRYGIYEIRCIPNSRVYIGQAKRCFITRWLEHQGDLLKHRHNQYMQRSYDKYGIEMFEVSVLEFLPDELEHLNNLRLKGLKERKELITSEDTQKITQWLNDKETYYIKKYRNEHGYKSVFNANDGGNGQNPTPELRRRIGQKIHELYLASPERKQILSEMMKKRYMDPEEREYLSEQMKIICRGLAYKEKVSKIRKGKKHSESHIEALRQSTIKRYEKHEEHEKLSKAMKESRSKGIGKENMSNGQKKRFEDPEQRRKISESEKGKLVSEETKEALSIKGKELWQDEHYRNMMRKSRISDEQRAVDDILWMVYQIKPKLRFRSLEWKLAFIDKLAQEL